MEDQLHIIITGDRGNIFSLPCSRKKIAILLILSVTVLIILLTASIFSISLFSKNRQFAGELNELREQLRTSAGFIAENQRISEEQQLRLKLKVAKLELNNIRQAAEFKEEKQEILSTAINELSEKSELIGRMIDSIGIEVPQGEESKNSGGPFIKYKESAPDELLLKADRYLKAIRYLPFGRPVDGLISSGFGKRTDPVNGMTAFHPGIDLRSGKGNKVYATADGVVEESDWNGSYGNYVLINHGNGYATAFAHLQKSLVKEGAKVHRGQAVGLVGNTGRSTGAHLHYEITLDNKPINPYTFMEVASLTGQQTSSPEKEK